MFAGVNHAICGHFSVYTTKALYCVATGSFGNSFPGKHLVLGQKQKKTKIKFQFWLKTELTETTKKQCFSANFGRSKLQDISPTSLPCVRVQSYRSPAASTICQASSTVCSTCSPQHVWKPCFFCRWTNSLEFTTT